MEALSGRLAAACAAATAFAVTAAFFFVVDNGQFGFFGLLFFIFRQIVYFDFVFFGHDTSFQWIEEWKDS
ncbi:hypothetical protein NEIFLAOT_00745 [Neisseria flavescens NRL30031/H210]|uniref:Uncharacterized protein n=1 Tax=Neisseria flavescens NRL30031/H210 TaxID=546264 RepID=C0ELE0_NEIFL|nr:hypothetical protein NEIFLAOT_00745 [Neisseria flavescens NRL30031/H210]